jgi:hypothetical protein
MAVLDKEKTLARIRRIDESEARERLLLEAGFSLLKEDSVGAFKVANEISDGVLRSALYRKIAEVEAKGRSAKPPLSVFLYLGLGREKAKKDESSAIPLYEKALREIETMPDPREKSHLLGALAAEWGPMSEERALQVAAKIPPEFSEALSFALLQVGTRLRKWNRKDAGEVFQKSFGAAARIQDPLLRSKRLLQIAREWQWIDRKKAGDLLGMSERECPATKRNKILCEIFLAQASLEPEKVFAIARKAPDFIGARVLLERAILLANRYREENIKRLETALQFARARKNDRLLGDAAVVWSLVDPEKGLEVAKQVESKEIRFGALRRMAKESHLRRFLEQATQEAMGMDSFDRRFRALKEAAADWATIDREKAKAIYQMAYQAARKTTF